MDRKSRLHLIITIAMMVFIFVQSALPGHLSGAESGFFVNLLRELTGLDQQSLSLLIRKAAHFTEYMILGILLFINVTDLQKNKGKNLSAWASWASAWAAGTTYAVTDEIHQFFVPDRACSATDMLIDSAGVATGAAIALLLSRLKKH